MRRSLASLSRFTSFDLRSRSINRVTSGTRLIIRSAMKRRESRGLHYTLDYPAADDEKYGRDTILRAGDFS